MEEKVEVLFGSSFAYPDTIIVKQVWRLGDIEDNEGNRLGPLYDDEAESWMARTDMSCNIFAVKKSEIGILSEKYKNFIKASWEVPCDEGKVERLKEEFLTRVGNKKVSENRG